MFGKLKEVLGFDGFNEDEEFDEVEEIEEEVEEERDLSNVISQVQRKSNKVVNIHTANAAKLTIAKPLTYDDAQEICSALKNRKIVVINTTALELRVAQRLIDFVGGACYALEAEIQEVEKGVVIVTPSNVEVSNELKNELSSKGIFNWSK